MWVCTAMRFAVLWGIELKVGMGVRDGLTRFVVIFSKRPHRGQRLSRGQSTLKMPETNVSRHIRMIFKRFNLFTLPWRSTRKNAICLYYVRSNAKIAKSLYNNNNLINHFTGLCHLFWSSHALFGVSHCLLLAKVKLISSYYRPSSNISNNNNWQPNRLFLV